MARRSGLALMHRLGLLAHLGLPLGMLPLGTVLVPVLLAPPAAAQKTDAGDGKGPIARDLFERGKAQWTLGQYEEAASLLAASNQQVPRAGTCLLLADAYERLGRLRTARDTFQLASKLARDSGDSQLEYRANTREAALLPRLPRIEVRIPAPLPQGLLVTLNGVELPPAELNVPTVLDAGHYQLEARAPGHRPFLRDVELVNRGPQALGVQVVSVLLNRGDEETHGAGEPDDSVDGRRELAWWVGGVGGALFLGGMVSLLVAIDKDGDSNGECGLDGGAVRDDENACTQRGADLRAQARTYAHLATAGSLLGLAGVGAGVALHFSAPARDEPTSAGVTWSGSF